MLSKLYGYLAGAGALILGILAALGMAKRAGRKEEQDAQRDKALEQSKESNEIDTKTRATSDTELDERLRRHQRD